MPTRPLVHSWADIHSNVSQQMIDQADVLIEQETYPEIDMAARGRECADVLVDLSKLVCVRQWHYTNCRCSGG